MWRSWVKFNTWAWSIRCNCADAMVAGSVSVSSMARALPITTACSPETRPVAHAARVISVRGVIAFAWATMPAA